MMQVSLCIFGSRLIRAVLFRAAYDKAVGPRRGDWEDKSLAAAWKDWRRDKVLDDLSSTLTLARRGFEFGEIR